MMTSVAQAKQTLQHFLPFSGPRQRLPRYAIFITASLFLQVTGCTGQDRREDAINGNIPCMQYDEVNSAFSMQCDIIWTAIGNGLADDDYVTLEANEVFDGHDHHIDLDGILNWHGAFKIDEGANSLDNAPEIRNLHMRNGETSSNGGFLIQEEQANFIVDSCSSTGIIQGGLGGGGGICGNRCSGDIRIKNCHSSGTINGRNAGGIAGGSFGLNSDFAEITNCYSTGDITGLGAGGISGQSVGFGGHVIVSFSHSTGEISGSQSGGISGFRTGENAQEVVVKQCYSVGQIHGNHAGGITGSQTAHFHADVFVTDCYSRGEIRGTNGGGICGSDVGTSGGSVTLTNTYATGEIVSPSGGGLIGLIHSAAKEINIIMSVYNAGQDGNDPMIGTNNAQDKTNKDKNSGDLGKITGKLYCYSIDNCWDDAIWQATKEFPEIILPSETEIAGSSSSLGSVEMTVVVISVLLVASILGVVLVRTLKKKKQVHPGTDTDDSNHSPKQEEA